MVEGDEVLLQMRCALPTKLLTPPSLGVIDTLKSILEFVFLRIVIELLVLPVRIAWTPISYLLFRVRFTPPDRSFRRRVVANLGEEGEEKANGYQPLVCSLRSSFASGITRPYQWRVRQLLGILAMLEEHDEEIYTAYCSDIGKPRGDWFMERRSIEADIKHIIANLHRWMQPEKKAMPIWMAPGSSRIMYEPLGCVLIVGPFNYPMTLTLTPLAAALAAGNVAVIKPSELCPATSAFLSQRLPEYVDGRALAIVEGDIPATTSLLEEKWDKIFFTGSERVAKIIERKVAGTLTPLCLELGGKSPAIVDRSADLAVSCRRIAHGKFFNCGATCIAPDYVLVEEEVRLRFLDQLKRTVRDFYGDDAKQSPDYGRLVNAAHARRLSGFLDDCTVEIGGTIDEQERFMEPTVLSGVTEDSAVMREEIFGPILPVLGVPSVDDAIEFVNRRPKPLAHYVFTQRAATKRAVLNNISSGGACVNEAIYQFANHNLPFGGVGPSGMGNYHGHHGFLCFSHSKSVVDHMTFGDKILGFVRYPPLTPFKLSALRKVM